MIPVKCPLDHFMWLCADVLAVSSASTPPVHKGGSGVPVSIVVQNATTHGQCTNLCKLDGALMVRQIA